MKNDPIKLMFYEHDVIMQTNEIIGKLDGYWNIDAAGYVDIVNEMLDFFINYADGYHHRKEEDVLFPALKGHPDFKLYEIIDEFNEHHNSFREYAHDIKESMVRENFPESYESLRHYNNDLLDHIAAENDELFVLAQSLLSESELEKIYFHFKDVDMQLGEDRKIKFEKKPDTWKEIIALKTSCNL